MSVRIRVSDSDVQRQRVTLGGVPYEIRLTWRDLPGAWYLSVFGADGDAIVTGARLVSDWLVARTARRSMGGLFVVIGEPDRTSFPDSGGDDCALLWVPDSEIPAPERMDGLIVTLPPADPPGNSITN